MAILHPLECYLLETFSSAEHFAATRDAIIEWIDAHEAAFARLQSIVDPDERSKPYWQQGDLVWGKRFLPILRSHRDFYINAHVQRVNNDPLAFKENRRLDFNDLSFSEFRNGWMTETERQLITLARDRAAKRVRRLSITAAGDWNEGALTYNGQGKIYRLAELPERIPRYVLDSGVRVEKGQHVTLAGIYLPDEDFASAQFLYPNASHECGVKVKRGIKRSILISSATGMRNFDWNEDDSIETGWALIRRVVKEYIYVPRAGFFPEGRPEELYDWPESEQQQAVCGLD